MRDTLGKRMGLRGSLRRQSPRYLRVRTLSFLALLSGASAAAPEEAEPPPAAGDEGVIQPTREEIEAFLESRSLPQSDARPASPLEPPPPPPRHRGVVVEAGSGAAFPLGALRYVSPPSPWFQFQVGYEPTTWFMALVNADFTLANTRYAARPPEPRTYAHYAFGAGARFQLAIGERFGAHAQLELGASEVSEEVLVQYGYTRADRLNFHYGARLGLEWLQINPHLALGLQGTLRNYPGLARVNDSDPPTAVIVAALLRYAF